MNLLDQIIESGTMNTPPPLASVLRACILLSSQLKVPALRTWAESEINGYSRAVEIPNYRLMNASAFGDFDGTRSYSGRLISPESLGSEGQWFATKIRLFDSIGYLESIGQEGLSYPWPSPIIDRYRDKLLPDAILVKAWQFIPRGAIVGMLERIRTRVLTTMIDIKTDFESDEVDLRQLVNVRPGSPESEKAKQTIVNNILNGNFYFGNTHTEITQITQNIQIENWESLQAALENSGIDEAEREQLQAALQHEKTMGDGVKG
jgi:AbiTii